MLNVDVIDKMVFFKKLAIIMIVFKQTAIVPYYKNRLKIN